MSFSPGIVQLAERIESDIRERSLPAGHPFETTAETARRFGVSTGRANRALQLLSNRGTIIRRQRAGTVVGEGPGDDNDNGLKRLNIVVSETPVRTEGLLDDGIMLGLQAALPGVALRQHFLPGGNAARFIEDIVSGSLKAEGKDGFVLFRCPAVVQRVLAESGLPTVVAGGVHLSVAGVAALDRDQFRIGVELAAYALRKRCSRFVCLLRDRPGPGDRKFAKGLTHTLAGAGVSLDRVVWEHVEPDEGTIRATVAEHLQNSGKIAFLCRNEYLAEQTRTAILRTKSKTPSYEIAMADCYRPDPADAAFPFPRPEWSAEEVGAKLGRLLVEQAGKKNGDRTLSETLIPISAAT